MKPKHLIYFLAAFALLFSACKKEIQIKKETLSGYAQKGPLVNGASVTIAELNTSFNQTGKTYYTTISNNSGSFELNNIELASQYVELKADGFYFNEISGQTSSAPMTLYALADIEDVNSVNVNVLTHLEKPRVEYLVKQGMGFSDAKQQALQEVLSIFGFDPINNSSEALNLTKDAVLLAISCILQGRLSTGDMMQLMAQISADMRQDGTLDNVALGTKLMNNTLSIKLSLSTIRNNLKNKYAELGITTNIPDFESYIESFINSELYPLTLAINYPDIGLFGVNILSDNVTEVNLRDFYDFYGSLRAEVPEGLSLKVILRGGLWYWSAILGSSPNWTITTYDYATQSQIFTVTESGKFSDLKFHMIRESASPYITIEFYENGATVPTKTKQLHVIL